MDHESLFILRSMRVFIRSIAFAFLFLAFQHEAFGQWKQAPGFSNENAFNAANVDAIFGLIPWGDSLLGSASCAISSADQGATFDSLWLSTDHGQTWVDFAPNGGLPMVVVGNNFIGGAEPDPTSSNPNEVVSYSTDRGQTWKTDTAGWGGTGASSMFTIGNNIFMSDDYGIYKQTTPGTSWTIDTAESELGANSSSIVAFTVSGSNLFVSTAFNGVYVSTNQGTSWLPINSGWPSILSYGMMPVWAFASSGSSLFAAIAHDTANGGADFDSLDFYRTTDDGQNWSKMNTTLQNWGSLYQFIAIGHSLFAATDSGFYASTDNSGTWNLSQDGLQFAFGDHPYCVQVSGGNVVIGTSASGAWYRSLSDFGESSVAPSTAPHAWLSLALSQNPASSSGVTITYTLPEASVARVQLMDELGREVRMLQNGHASAGQNALTIDPLMIETGTYFVRIESNSMSAMQKLVITR